MATWHQLKSRVPLWHPTKWTLVIDPMHRCRALVLFDTEKEAKQARANHIGRKLEDGYILGHNDLYILQPHKEAVKYT